MSDVTTEDRRPPGTLIQMVNPELGGDPATTTVEAFHQLWEPKGFVELTEEEADDIRRKNAEQAQAELAGMVNPPATTTATSTAAKSETSTPKPKEV